LRPRWRHLPLDVLVIAKPRASVLRGVHPERVWAELEPALRGLEATVS
jgi:hypothetical protein